MKISNFRDYTKFVHPDPYCPGTTATTYYATVDVKRHFFSKTETRQIVRNCDSKSWRFFDDKKLILPGITILEQEYLTRIAKEAVACL